MHKVDSFLAASYQVSVLLRSVDAAFFFCNDSRYRSSKIRASDSGGLVKRNLFVLLLNLLLVLPISAQRTSHSTSTTHQRSTTTTSKPNPATGLPIAPTGAAIEFIGIRHCSSRSHGSMCGRQR